MSARRRVTNHALLRYMERVLGIDVEQLRGHIADSVERHQGAPCVRALDARFLLVNGRVVTTLAGDTVPRHEFLVRLMRERA